MASPLPPRFKITTPYKKPGKMWSCGYHVGVDFAAPTGTPVMACKDGKVLEAKEGVSWGPSYGKAVVIDHGDGLRAVYAHLNVIGVKAGDKVTEGQEIGKVGSTGNSSGPHLHLECRLSPWKYTNKDTDPQVLLDGSAKTSLKAKIAAKKADKRPVAGGGDEVEKTNTTPEEKPKKKATLGAF